jgi:hypothetical protein
MPACLKRASIAFLDSPVKPGNDGVRDGDVVIIMGPLIIANYLYSIGFILSTSMGGVFY